MPAVAREEMVTIPRRLYEALLESIDVLASREALRSLTRAFRDVERGRVLTLDELERRVRLQTTAVRVYEAVTADVEVSEGEIRNYYEEHPQEFLGADGSPVPFSAVRDSIAESLMEEEKNGAYAAWLDARRRAATLVIVMDDWWRSMQDEQQS